MYNAKYNTVYRMIIRKFFVPLRFFVEKLYSLRLIPTSLVHVIRNNLTFIKESKTHNVDIRTF